MLDGLHVKNLALIKEADISFKDGFNVLTGETGAGKSIVLGSIGLALGAKAPRDIIRAGEEYALIELMFSLDETGLKRLKELDMPVENDGSVILSRKISETKSISRINGETVTLSQLKEVSGVLIDIYGQHDYQGLLKKSAYLNMLDDYAGDKAVFLKDKIKEKNAALKEYLSKKDSLTGDDKLRERERELLLFEVNEISEANLKTGEDAGLDERYRLLLNMGKLKEGVSEVHKLTGYEDELSAGALLGRALSRLKALGELDDKARELSDELSETESLLNDFNRELSAYTDTLSFDGEEFAGIEDRLNLINRLKDKYGGSIEAVLKALDEKSDELSRLDNYEEYVKELDNKINEEKSALLKLCKELSDIRRDVIPELENKLTDELKGLNFNDVSLEFSLISNEDKITDTGFDTVELMLSLNAGEAKKPLQMIASGGELSRIMLAVKSIFAQKDDVPTLIFDEIDSGISGITAYRVSEMMGKLSKSHQLICITHLPQIAAMADYHFLIEKTSNEGRTVTGIMPLDDNASVRELARLLGSDEITDAALLNARELKNKAKGGV